MKKCLTVLLVGLLAIASLASCGKNSSETDWYKDWMDRNETTTVPAETTKKPAETTKKPVETTTEPEATTTEPIDITVPEETTAEPVESTAPAETTTAPAETTTEFDWGHWDDYHDAPVVTPSGPTETTAAPVVTSAPEDNTDPEDTTPDTPGDPEPEAEYTITYVLDGGSLPSNAIDRFHSYMSVTLPTPTKTGYSFRGWYTAADFSGNAVSELSFGTVGDQTFYACWAPLQPADSEPGLWFPIIPLPSGSDK